MLIVNIFLKALDRRGQARVELGKYEEAIEDYKKAKEVDQKTKNTEDKIDIAKKLLEKKKKQEQEENKNVIKEDDNQDEDDEEEDAHKKIDKEKDTPEKLEEEYKTKQEEENEEKVDERNNREENVKKVEHFETVSKKVGEKTNEELTTEIEVINCTILLKILLFHFRKTKQN